MKALNVSDYVKVKQDEQNDRLPNSLQLSTLSNLANSQRETSHSLCELISQHELQSQISPVSGLEHID